MIHQPYEAVPQVSSTTALEMRAQAPSPSHATVQRWLFTILVLWALTVLGLTAAGITAQLPTPLLPVPVALGIIIPLVIYARSTVFRDYIHALDLRALTLFNVWRIPAALAFFYYGAQGELPPVFVRNAGWGDLIAGVLAIPMVLGAVWLGRQRWAAFTGYHLFSLTDFVVAVGTGFYFSLQSDPLMDTLKHLPMSVIPLYGVPITGAFSAMTLHRLFTRRA
jgi:hypothetical protein